MATKSTSTGAQPVWLGEPFTVTLDRLTLSGDNVRDTNSVSKEGVAQMAAMLLAQGQINPLVVSKTGEGFCVHAGGRRLRGFWKLRDDTKIAADFAVTVREVAPEAALDISLTENLSQEAMHPVDEFQAFARLAQKGQTEQQIAKAFGLSVLHVKRRLKLSTVAPSLLDLFRQKEIGLDEVMALTACHDQDHQVQLWKSLPTWNRSAQHIARRLADEEVSSDDPRLKLVSVEQYVAAGGALRQDLFSEKGTTQHLCDGALLDFLIAEKLEERAAEVRGAGWAWVDVLPELGYSERRHYLPYPTSLLPETDEQAQRRQALQTEIDLLQEQVDALTDAEETDDADTGEGEQGATDWDGIDRLQESIEALEKQIREIELERVDLDGVDKAVAGALVYLDEGQIVCDAPLVRASDRKQLQTIVAKNNESQDAQNQEGAAPKEAPISESLMRNLSAHRTAALQASLMQNTPVALACLASAMAQSQFHWGGHDNPVKVSTSAQWHVLEQASPSMAQGPAYEALVKAKEAWKGRLPEKASELLAYFLAQPMQTSLDMLVFCTSLSVNAIQTTAESRSPAHEIAQAIALDMGQWWSPNADNYLSLVPKVKIIEALVQAKGDGAALGLDKLKKPDLVVRAESLLVGSGWLPQSLR